MQEHLFVRFSNRPGIEVFFYSRYPSDEVGWTPSRRAYEWLVYAASDVATNWTVDVAERVDVDNGAKTIRHQRVHWLDSVSDLDGFEWEMKRRYSSAVPNLQKRCCRNSELEFFVLSFSMKNMRGGFVELNRWFVRNEIFINILIDVCKVFNMKLLFFDQIRSFQHQ